MPNQDLKVMLWTTFVTGCIQPELTQHLKERRLYVDEPITAEEEMLGCAVCTVCDESCYAAMSAGDSVVIWEYRKNHNGKSTNLHQLTLTGDAILCC